MKELSVKDKIEILKKMKEKLKDEDYQMKFLCCMFDEITHCNFDHISQVFPMFKVENAIMVCEKQKLKKPNDSYARWNSSEVKSRLAFVNWMIKELEKEL